MPQGGHIFQTIGTGIHPEIAVLALVTLGPHHAHLALALSCPRITPVQDGRAQGIAVAPGASQLHQGEAYVALIALLTREPRPAQALTVGAVAESALGSFRVAAARITAHRRVAPVAHLAPLAVPALGVAMAGDALAGGHVARTAGAVAPLAAAPHLQWVTVVAIVAHLAVIARIALRALGADVLRVLDQLELGVQVAVVVALQLAARREVVRLLRQGAGAPLAVLGGSLQRVSVVAQLTTFTAKKEKIYNGFIK